VGLKRYSLLAACAISMGSWAADTRFSKPEYRVTLPGVWKDASERDLDAFANVAGTRELTVSFMVARQPVAQQELRPIVVRLLEQYARAHRELSGSSAKIESPIISQSGRYIRGELWGEDASGRKVVTVLFGDANGVRSFTYVGVRAETKAFRVEATRVFDQIELK
jgi:hypothetical protein